MFQILVVEDDKDLNRAVLRVPQSKRLRGVRMSERQ